MSETRKQAIDQLVAKGLSPRVAEIVIELSTAAICDTAETTMRDVLQIVVESLRNEPFAAMTGLQISEQIAVAVEKERASRS